MKPKNLKDIVTEMVIKILTNMERQLYEKDLSKEERMVVMANTIYIISEIAAEVMLKELSEDDIKEIIPGYQ